MSRLLAAFLAPLLFCLGISGKTVTGIFRSEAARRENGQFITAFVFRGDGGLLVCQLDDPALAAQKQSKLLLYQDLDLELDSLSCAEKLRKAQITVSLSQEEHNQSIPHQAPPTSWTLLYTDRHTCQENPEDPADPDLTFTVLLLNPDSAGNPLDHFSAEEAGIHTFFSLLLLSYFISCCIYLGPLQQALRKRGPMHTALKLLTAALAIQGCSALCRYIHLCRYSTDGSGFALMDHLADCSLGHAVSGGRPLPLAQSLCWLDSDPGQEGPIQTSAVGVVSSLHGFLCGRSRCSGLLPVVPLPPSPGLHVRDLQPSPETEGGDCGRGPVPMHLHGDPLPALSVSLSVLGGVLAVLRVSAVHHVQNQQQGALVSMPLQTEGGGGSPNHGEHLYECEEAGTGKEDLQTST
ncbi:integral membrane protein GPR180 isoform X3 [Oryzias melastigma]|uniref:integral membrane protein GPR180 isoform X3 n=1 Tax=Oryzias melastigma TaxID=30732 RepID=UPI00168D612E|nr:integral membrane protein GPR180 isoform X3 [Oryzias melastigma]